MINVKNITEWKNEISTIHENSENMHHKMKRNDQKNHYIKYQLKNDNEYRKIIIIENTRKFQAEKNVSMISARNIIWKRKKYDENLRNQNIMLRRKNIIDISIHKIQRRQRCVFNHNAQTSK